jgi:hypothetical protein
MDESVKETGARKRRRTAREQRAIGRRLRLLKTAPRTLDVVLSHVRNGGSLIELCDTWQVRYSDVIGWIREDRTKDGRSELYEQAMRDRSEWTDEMVLSEIRLRCRLDPRRLYNTDGTRKKVHELDADVARMIEEVKADGSIKFFGKKEALELAGKNRKLYTDSVQHSVDGKLEDILARSYDDPAPPPAAPPAA